MATQPLAKSGLFSQKQSGGMFAVEDQTLSTGNRFFVDAGSGTNGVTRGRNPSDPFASLAYVFSAAATNGITANQNDQIRLMAGHTEDVIAAGTITCATAGVTVTGEGEGDNRPIISFTTIDSADIDIDAADITFENISFRCDIASLIAALDVNASGFTLRNCSFMGTDAADEAFLIAIITDAAANDITIENCQFYQLYAADGTTAITTTSTEAIRLVGADRAVIKDCYFSGDYTTSCLNSITTASLDIRLLNNMIQNIATENITGGIDLHAGTTGFWDGNVLYVDDPTSPEDAVDDGLCATGVNWVSNAIGDAPIMWGAADALGVEGKIDIIDGYHDVPAADTTDDAQMRDVIGKKEDAAAAGAVTTTESLTAYAKQNVGAGISLIALHAVPAADTTDDANVRDVVGKKEDAAAAGAVTTTESLVAYAKQSVGANIAITALHGVPAADTTDDVNMRDVTGKKDDAAAAGAVSTAESLMAYAKQNVTNTEALTAARHAIVISSTITCSNIPDDGGSPQAAPLTGAASGDLMLEEIIMQTDSVTGLANPTTIQVISDNTDGLTGDTVPIWEEATANLGSGATINNTSADVNLLPMMLESGKKLYINGDDAVGTGGGTVEVIMKFVQVTAGATVAGV